jgi:hypothetical protein
MLRASGHGQQDDDIDSLQAELGGKQERRILDLSMQLTRHPKQYFAAVFVRTRRIGRRRNRVACRLGRVDPGDGILKFGERFLPGAAECGAVGQIRRNCDEAFVFGAPGYLRRIAIYFNHRSSSSSFAVQAARASFQVTGLPAICRFARAKSRSVHSGISSSSSRKSTRRQISQLINGSSPIGELIAEFSTGIVSFETVLPPLMSRRLARACDLGDLARVADQAR